MIKRSGPARRTGKSRRLGRIPLLRRFCRSEDGAAAVEYALVGLPFLLLLTLTLEHALAFYAHTSLNAGVEDLSRKIRTNQITGNSHTAAAFKQELCASDFMTLFDCNGLQVDVREIARFGDPGVPRNPDGSLNTNGFGFNPGGKVSINIVRVYYEWPAILAWQSFTTGNMWSNGKRLLVGSRAFRIEP